MAQPTFDLSLWDALSDGCKTSAIQRALPPGRLRRTEFLRNLTMEVLLRENVGPIQALDFITEIQSHQPPDDSTTATIRALQERILELELARDKKSLSSISSTEIRARRFVVEARFIGSWDQDVIYFRWPPKTEKDGIYSNIKSALRAALPDLKDVSGREFDIPDDLRSSCKKLLSHWSTPGGTDMMLKNDCIIEVKNSRRIYDDVQNARKDGRFPTIENTLILPQETEEKQLDSIDFTTRKAKSVLESFDWFLQEDPIANARKLDRIADIKSLRRNVFVSCQSSVSQTVAELLAFQLSNLCAKPMAILTSFDRAESSFIFFFSSENLVENYYREELESSLDALRSAVNKLEERAAAPPRRKKRNRRCWETQSDDVQVRKRQRMCLSVASEMVETYSRQFMDVDSSDDTAAELSEEQVQNIVSERIANLEKHKCVVVGAKLTYEEMFRVLWCVQNDEPTGWDILDDRLSASPVSFPHISSTNSN